MVVNTFKHHIKNLFFNKLQKRDDNIFTLLLAKPSHITFCPLIIFVAMCSIYLCSLYFPRDDNENKVNPDLYYVISATLCFQV